jgi:hypothetical protein
VAAGKGGKGGDMKGGFGGGKYGGAYGGGNGYGGGDDFDDLYVPDDSELGIGADGMPLGGIMAGGANNMGQMGQMPGYAGGVGGVQSLPQYDQFGNQIAGGNMGDLLSLLILP